MRKLVAVLVLTGTAIPALWAQSGGAAQPVARPKEIAPPITLSFEVASVKPTISQTEWGREEVSLLRETGHDSGSPIKISGLRVDIGMTMKGLISTAYGIDARLIAGPDWVNQGEARFEIHAIMPEGSTAEQIPNMLRALLEERFHMLTHRAVIELPAYVLVTGKNGSKLKKPRDVDRSACDSWVSAPGSDDGSDAQLCRSAKMIGDRTVNIRIMTRSPWGPLYSEFSRDESHDEYFRITIPQLAQLLTGMIAPGSSLGRGGALGPTSAFVQIVDWTGIEGAWDVVLDGVRGDAAETLSSLSASLEEQGLRLERSTAPVEKLIIDKVDKVPTEN